ncbi:hypothetical protein M430DRAFT_165930 [Amorphotheca resinae ATCC 22711]|uniref:Cytochrome P450 n=1 Tax=Amorphotheca resinae ATCC 22711 TaxID=857342 RepID=A0A2T3BG36_AMORE|nr:hypothetical protein M430DRAFT_165930 [Amorphotheca resinae ATCC 22711]PSS28335.1 hypothetical protein M430DRAFT_165930 [Amorphotheca resinae ATCC 22711]
MFDPSAAIISLIERFMTVTVPKSNEPRPIPTIPEFIYKTAICFIGAWLAQFILGGLFNSANHPLVDFPGPKRAAFTEWYRTYLELFCGRSWVHVLEEWHQKYGKIVRVGPNELSFSDPAAYHEIYNSSNFWDKEASVYQSFGQDHATFGFLKYADAKKRKDIMSPLLSRKAISDLQELVQSNVDRLCEGLTNNNAAGRSSDLFFGLRCFAVDTTTSVCFAISVDALDEPEFKAPIVEAMEKAPAHLVLFKHFPWLQSIFIRMPRWLTVMVAPQTSGIARVMDILRTQIKDAMANPYSLKDSSRHIVYHALLSVEANEGAKSADEKSLLQEAQSLLLCGSDAVSNQIMLGTWHLLESPALVRRLNKELLKVWPVLDIVPSFAELEKLPLLTAVVKETLRIGPGGIPGVLPRVVPEKGATINGSFIPQETIVGMSGYFVHHAESIFKDPKTFDPDRWLGEDSESLDKWLVSFSKGPRSCLGINLAYCELYLVLAALFRRFDIELDSAR